MYVWMGEHGKLDVHGRRLGIRVRDAEKTPSGQLAESSGGMDYHHSLRKSIITVDLYVRSRILLA